MTLVRLFEGPRLPALPLELVATEDLPQPSAWTAVEKVPGPDQVEGGIGRGQTTDVEHSREVSLAAVDARVHPWRLQIAHVFVVGDKIIGVLDWPEAARGGTGMPRRHTPVAGRGATNLVWGMPPPGHGAAGAFRERVLARVGSWVGRRPHRFGGHNPWAVAVEVGRAAGHHRLTGVAAEMAFFAVLGLVPLTLSFGAALGYLGRMVGAERITEARDAVIVVLTTLIGPELTVDVVAPFVRTLLGRERGGVALGSLLVAFWLGSRTFAPALHAADVAHEVDVHRSALRQRLLGVGMAAGSLLVSVLTLAIMILEPLLGGGYGLAAQLGMEQVYRTLWTVGRWPFLLVLLTCFLVCFYRFAPSARIGWRQSVPGAVVGMALWVLAALSFRLYLAVGGRPGTDFSGAEELIATVGRAVTATIATMLWAFLSSLAILVGGEVNAILQRRGPEEGR